MYLRVHAYACEPTGAYSKDPREHTGAHESTQGCIRAQCHVHTTNTENMNTQEICSITEHNLTHTIHDHSHMCTRITRITTMPHESQESQSQTNHKYQTHQHPNFIAITTQRTYTKAQPQLHNRARALARTTRFTMTILSSFCLCNLYMPAKATGLQRTRAFVATSRCSTY